MIRKIVIIYLAIGALCTTNAWGEATGRYFCSTDMIKDNQPPLPNGTIRIFLNTQKNTARVRYGQTKKLYTRLIDIPKQPNVSVFGNHETDRCTVTFKLDKNSKAIYHCPDSPFINVHMPCLRIESAPGSLSR